MSESVSAGGLRVRAQAVNTKPFLSFFLFFFSESDPPFLVIAGSFRAREKNARTGNCSCSGRGREKERSRGLYRVELALGPSSLSGFSNAHGWTSRKVLPALIIFAMRCLCDLFASLLI